MERNWLDSSPLVPRQSTSNYHVPGAYYQGLLSLCSAYFIYSFTQGFLRTYSVSASVLGPKQLRQYMKSVPSILPSFALLAQLSESEVEWGWI